MNKLIFFLKRPKIVIVTGSGRKTAREAVERVLSSSFKVGKEVLIYETDLKNSQDFKFFVKHARLAILVVTHVGEYHPDKGVFAGELVQVAEAASLAENLPAHSYFVLNFDDETVRDLKNRSRAHSLTFGFGMRADIKATDIVLTQMPALGTNFKINYQGNIVPVWLEKLFGKEQIYAALAAVAVGEIMGLNLVEISEALKSYQSLPGRMKLIKGIKNSWLLDNSASTSVFSITEALDILAKIETKNRKIAVLGDILGIGKHTIEAHEAIGERVAKTADLLFTFGSRAKFIAQGAQSKGMALDKIFQYDTVETDKTFLENEIREGDFILLELKWKK